MNRTQMKVHRHFWTKKKKKKEIGKQIEKMAGKHGGVPLHQNVLRGLDFLFLFFSFKVYVCTLICLR